jgi:hypothetical protein
MKRVHKKPARAKARGSFKRKARGGVPAKLENVFKLGVVKEIILRSERDGQLYRHVFKSNPAILASSDARGLLLLKGHISVERSTLHISG